MDRVVNAARQIRQNLRASRFQCLSSLLHRMAEEFGADEVGLIERVASNSGVQIKRRISLASDSSFGARVLSGVSDQQGVHSALSRICSLAENPSKPFFRYFDIGEEVDDLGVRATPTWDWILMVSVWPSTFWGNSGEKRYWLYLWSPRLILGPGVGDGAHVAAELLSLGSEWFGWKHNRLAYRSQLLREVSLSPSDVIDAVRRTIVRPLLPLHMAEIAGALTRQVLPATTSATKLLKSIDGICQLANPCNIEEDRPGVDSGRSCKGCVECPQIKYVVTVKVVAELALWEVSPPQDLLTTATASSASRKFLGRAILALESAAVLLNSDSSGNTLRFDADQVSDVPSGAKERLLLRFFACRAIFEALSRFDEKWRHGQQPTDGELQFLASLAKLATLLLTNDEWSPEAIRNLIRVFAGYGHWLLDIPSIVDLARHLRQTLRGESALYTLKQRYRDHFFHTIEVCLIGFVILRSHATGNEPQLAEVLVKTCRIWNDVTGANVSFAVQTGPDLLAQWWVASLCHDTAYGIDVLKGTLDLLDFFGNHVAIEKFNKKVSADVATLHDELKAVAPELLNDPTIGKGDHGLIAASHLYQTLVRNQETLAQQFLPAIRAIAFHNTKFPSVNAAIDPIAALLILCDTIQDWGRSQLGYDRSPTVILSRLVSSARTPNEEQFGPVSSFGFTMSPIAATTDSVKIGKNGELLVPDNWHPTEYVWKDQSGKSCLEISLDYSARACRGLGIFFTWADTTFGLRRVDFRPWGLAIRVTHRLPLTEGQRPKMNELADYVYQQEIGFVEPWVRTALARDRCRSVCHEVSSSNDGSWETLSFNLAALSEAYILGERLIFGSLGTYADAIGKMPTTEEDERVEPRQRRPIVLIGM